MKTQRISPKLQPLTPEALAFIQAIAADHSVGLEKRCARYRRRADFRRVVVALSLVTLLAFGSNVVYAKSPLYTEIVSSGTIDKVHVCETIQSMLNQKL